MLIATGVGVVGTTAVGSIGSDVGISVGVAVGIVVKVGETVGVSVTVGVIGVGVIVGVSLGVCVAVFVGVVVGVNVGVAVTPTPASGTLLPSITSDPVAGVPSTGKKDTPIVQEPLAVIELHPATAPKTGLETDKVGSGRGEVLLFKTCRFWVLVSPITTEPKSRLNIADLSLLDLSRAISSLYLQILHHNASRNTATIRVLRLSAP